jgi:parallel beta-helix repeat protein
VQSQPKYYVASDMVNIRSRIASSSNNPNLKIAITELNINTQNPASNTYTGVGANGFITGQWMAEVFARGLHKPSPSTNAQVAFMLPWSIHEKEGDRSAGDLSIFDDSYANGVKKRSTYHHIKLMANNFHGNFRMATTTDTMIKVFSSFDCYQVSVMYLNQAPVTRTLVVNFHNTYPTYSGSVGVHLDIHNVNVWPTKTFTIGPKETRLYIYDPCGRQRGFYTYNRTHNSTYSDPSYTATANRFCSCILDYGIGQIGGGMFPNYHLRCADPGDTGDNHYDDFTLTENAVLADSAFITGVMTVPNGFVLTIDEAEVSMGNGAQIVVEEGGKIIVSNSKLRGCPGERWQGISITGDGTDDTQVSISNSDFQDAVVAIKMDNVTQASVTGNTFENATQGIRMHENTGFTISSNEFIECSNAINTSYCGSATSLIEKNLFFKQDTAIYFDSDDHDLLDISCNDFVEYASFGVYSDATVLKDQGDADFGAGNQFVSGSTETNHQLLHTRNSIDYYTDPSFPFSLSTSGTYAAITIAASNDKDCTGGGARPMNTNNKIVKENMNTSKLIGCFPNPASNKTTFTYNLSENVTSAEIKVVNMFGELLLTYDLEKNSHSKESDVINLQSGIYFYTLVVDGKNIGSKKMVISK